MANYNRDMDEAPQDEDLLLLVPTGDADEPLLIESGTWDASAGFGGAWVGAWRHYDESVSDNDPIAWARKPEIDDDILRDEIALLRARLLEPAN